MIFSLLTAQKTMKKETSEIIDDTLTEMQLILLIIMTFGFAYFIFKKPVTDKSVIRFLFRYIDYFPKPDWTREEYANLYDPTD